MFALKIALQGTLFVCVHAVGNSPYHNMHVIDTLNIKNERRKPDKEELKMDREVGVENKRLAA